MLSYQGLRHVRSIDTPTISQPATYTPCPPTHPDQDENGSIVVRTSDELDALIDRVLTETKDHRFGAIIPVGIRGHSGYPILEVGLGREKGFINYHANDGGSTEGAGNADELAEYVYMGNLSEVPADVEVPVPLVRQGLHEFFRTGERPSVVRSSSRA